jgi:putative ABC transport system substrate-binding protein
MTVIRRAAFIVVGYIALLAGHMTVEAQPPAAVRRIGFLGNSTPTLEANLVGPFVEGLRDHGYVEGQNIAIEFRWAGGNYERFPALIAELLARKVEVIVTAGTPASQAVQKATTSVPLVMVAVGDPVATGLVPDLARPGGNITGVTSISEEIEGKRLELLREVVPRVSHVAALGNSANASQKKAYEQLRAAAAKMHIKLLFVDVRATGQLDDALALIARERPEALLVFADRVFLYNRDRIMSFATQQRLPGVHAYRELVESGGLMSFGPSYAGMHRRAAYYVDRILKGAKPGDLPVERPKTFELVVNLRAARALGLTIPQSVMLRADHVIE